MKELICIVCPKGCHLKVDEENGYQVTGNSCPKGAVYGKEELLHPMRVVTSTVKVDSLAHPRVSVKTDQAIPKEDFFKAMKLLNHVKLKPPVHRGEVVVPKILGSEVNFVVTRDIES